MSASQWLSGGGEMGRLIREKDWSATPLGPMESWPQSLRTTVSICLASNFPISIAWGPERIQIYNDGYWPICGAKHPESLGQDFKECWASAWPAIGETFENASDGQTGFVVNERIFIDRHGYLEETFFTFSFSPIRDESGGVGGLFHPVTEMTQPTLAERRLGVLRDLVERTAEAETVAEACETIAATLEENRLDVPFCSLYLLDAGGSRANLRARSGLPQDEGMSPGTVHLTSAEAPKPWPLSEALAAASPVEVDLTERPYILERGPYPESPRTALALPLRLSGVDHTFGVLVAGVSARRALDEPYQTFFAMLQSAVVTALTNARAYEEERRRAESLAELDRAKTTFFSNVSHELRTPLTLILGPVEDLLSESAEVERGTLDPAVAERLQVVHRSSRRLVKLVNTMLDFSRIEAGRVQGNYQPVDLGDYTAELASNFRAAIERAGMRLVVDCGPLPGAVYVDRDMWEKIVLNLLSNAFKYTFQGEIVVTVAAGDDEARVSVSDTGVGIPESELPRLFQRFHRVEGSRGRTHEGTGIGLALVHELVNLHGGTVEAESVVDEGSRFTVTLPFGSRHLDPERVGATSTLTPTTTGPEAFVEEALRWLPDENERRKPVPQDGTDSAVGIGSDATGDEADSARILWADDNADMREYVTRLLETRYEVESVPDGQAALEAARRRPPDLVLTDVMMPRLDGLGLVRALRSDPELRDIPVILLSARAGPEAGIEGRRAGADDYLVKPFGARELVARIEAQIRLARLRHESREVLNEALDRAEQASETKGRFLATVSHELRTPLSAVIGLADLMETEVAGPVTDQQRGYLARIRRSARHLVHLIDQILAFSRSEAGKERLSVGDVDLVELARDVGEALSPMARKKGLDLQLAASSTRAEIRSDGGKVRQVLTNLAGNAVKYTDAGSVTIAVVPEDDRVALQVRDTGAGIPEEHRERVFEPFFQGHAPGSGSAVGAGLGLAICRSLSELLEAELHMESEVGRGTTFTLRLPRTIQASAPASD